jgi:hypothetical protein
MSDELDMQKLIANMTPEERKDLASRMYNPLRCGGAGYDENGRYYLILGGKKCFAKEINQVIREMNPRWSDEQLKDHFVPEDT